MTHKRWQHELNKAKEYMLKKLEELEVPCSLRMMKVLAEEDGLEFSHHVMASAYWDMADEGSIQLVNWKMLFVGRKKK